MANKIDSNVTGLAFAEESALGVLPGTDGDAAVWHPLEPNSYKDFGSQVTTTARNPINASRQRRKGVVTDLDASGGFVQDLTSANTVRPMQGFFFAAARQKKSTLPLNGAKIVPTAVDAGDGTYSAATGLADFKVGAIVLATGFGETANNGLKTLSAAAAGLLTTIEALADEATPPASAKIETVGFKFPAASVAIALNGAFARMTSATIDLTTLGLIPGEWIYVGGDGVGNTFLNNAGFARIGAITAGYLEFDKTDWVPQAEVATGLTISIFFGTVIKNEKDPALITRRTLQIERTLGMDADGVMSEYVIGAVANEMSINMPMADKITVDMSYVGIDAVGRTGATGVKVGTRTALDIDSDVFNTSNDFSRIKLALVDLTTGSPTPLFGYGTEFNITINNNVTPDKAVGVLGAFDTTAGTFEVGGKIEAYFSDITAVQAVRENANVTLDAILVKAKAGRNEGIVMDIPLLSLGDGRLNVEQDQSIKLPLETNAAESKFGHTMLFQSFPYLPASAG